jgi:hypothetical protein
LVLYVRGLIGLVLIFLVVYSNKQIDIAAEYSHMEPVIFYNTLLSVIYFLFGFLIDLKRLIHLAKTKKFFINWTLLIPTIILIGLVSIPISQWILWFGLDIPILFLPFIFSELRAILTVIAGVMMVRSFVISKEKS